MLKLLPHLQATLNSVCAILLMTGFYFIKNGKKTAHKVCMTAALAASVLFMISYTVYHYNIGSVGFAGQGAVRPLYFLILITHTILATAVLPMILATLYHAVKGRCDAHKRIARWTLPVWLYVSLTGVIVYMFVYHLYAPAG
ncbi:MAG: putative membrane protein YozB [bacterium]|nr:MAG: putative membrane protein YozB [bacterium]